jgi:hypothetical protein
MAHWSITQRHLSSTANHGGDIRSTEGWSGVVLLGEASSRGFVEEGGVRLLVCVCQRATLAVLAASHPRLGLLDRTGDHLQDHSAMLSFYLEVPMAYAAALSILGAPSH